MMWTDFVTTVKFPQWWRKPFMQDQKNDRCYEGVDKKGFTALLATLSPGDFIDKQRKTVG